MRTRFTQAVLTVAALLLSACADAVTSAPPEVAATPRFNFSASNPQVVISQIYGGGGNSGATLRNDFIELHNRGTTAVDVTGWSVQYASAAGSTWQVTTLAGTIPAGGFYLVQQAQGSGGTVTLPTPDAIGSIAMSGTAGKVLLASQAAALAGTCPTVNVVDRVGFGTTATNCTTSTPGTTANLSNTTAALRLENGCKYTGNPAVDFEVTTPAPRNITSTPVTCASGPVVGPVASLDVAPATATLVLGTSQSLTVTAKDASGIVITDPAITWSTSNATVASVSTTGQVTAQALGTATITATAATNAAITATAAITVIAAPSLPPVRITEIHYDNAGTDVGEAVEIEAPAGTDLTGWKLLLVNGNGGVIYNTRILSGIVPNLCDGRGVVVLQYPVNGIQNGGTNGSEPDGLALVDAGNTVVEFLSYEGTITGTQAPLVGQQSRDIGAQQDNPVPPIGRTVQRSLADVWSLQDENFGGCNGRTSGTGLVTFSFSGRVPGDAALPVGFQDQLFVTIRRGGVVVDDAFTWSAVTPAVATIDERGVMTARAAGNATFRAELNDGTASADYTLPMVLALPWSSPTYAGNAAFGIPKDSDPSDEVILERLEFTSSFSRTRNIPNWVSYNLEETHIVSGQDRCDCFTFDPELVARGFTAYTTADYTGAGAFAGYGIDRGHLVRSFDRTAGALDNAHTFYFSNIVPQAADNNQGPWAAFETYLGDLARFNNREVYIIAGTSGSIGTLKGEGRVTIPEYVWKVAVVMPRDKGLGDFTSLDDGEVLAVVMPNVPGIRNVPWATYKVTVDSVESLSGYNVLDLLPDQVEVALESDTKPPVAVINGPFEILPGESVTLSAAGSTDPDGDALSYFWRFGDGANGSGLTTTHRYDLPGTYTVTLTVRDTRELIDEATTTVRVLSAADGVAQAEALITQLGTLGRVNRGLANSLAVKLNAAKASIERGQTTAAVGQLGALMQEINALVKAGVLTAEDVATTLTLLERIVASLTR